jgi:hypothetical protein
MARLELKMPDGTMQYHLEKGKMNVMGRHVDNEIVLDLEGEVAYHISRRQAFVRDYKGEFYIGSLGENTLLEKKKLFGHGAKETVYNAVEHSVAFDDWYDPTFEEGLRKNGDHNLADQHKKILFIHFMNYDVENVGKVIEKDSGLITKLDNFDRIHLLTVPYTFRR